MLPVDEHVEVAFVRVESGEWKISRKGCPKIDVVLDDPRERFG